MNASYDVQPPRIELSRFLRSKDDHEHRFNETRVVLLPERDGTFLRAPVRLCACGQATSGGIPDFADRVRVLTVNEQEP